MSTIDLTLTRGRAHAMVSCLNLSEIDHGHGHVRVKRVLETGIAKPGKKAVTFPIPAERARDLAEKLAEGIDTFVFDAGQTRGSAMKALNALCVAAGIDEASLRPETDATEDAEDAAEEFGVDAERALAGEATDEDAEPAH